MSDILTETKPKYEDLYNFLSSNPVQGYDIPKNIEEFLKQMKDRENANALYQTLKNSSDVKLAERHKDFETFRNNFDLNFDLCFLYVDLTFYFVFKIPLSLI